MNSTPKFNASRVFVQAEPSAPSRDLRRAPHRLHRPLDPAEFAEADFDDPARFTWLRHPSGRKHPINVNDDAVIRALLKCGWERVS